ncbi:MAG TPA: hypothetical protein VFZ73_10185 [Gemmatimonadaceae bacterium]
MLTSITLAMLMATAQPQPGRLSAGPIPRHLQHTTIELEAQRYVDSPVQGSRRDSLRNGAHIGAIVGGVIMAIGIAWLCLATHEKGDPSCVGPVLFWTAAGAGAGALAGAGIDSLFGRRIVLQSSVRF